ncbi:MAG: hypothetical protein WKF75_18370 [Singulisphaera sp.]
MTPGQESCGRSITFLRATGKRWLTKARFRWPGGPMGVEYARPDPGRQHTSPARRTRAGSSTPCSTAASGQDGLDAFKKMAFETTDYQFVARPIASSTSG